MADGTAESSKFPTPVRTPTPSICSESSAARAVVAARAGVGVEGRSCAVGSLEEGVETKILYTNRLAFGIMAKSPARRLGLSAMGGAMVGRVRLAAVGLACVAVVGMLELARSPYTPAELVGMGASAPNFLSSMLRRMEGKVAAPSRRTQSQGSKQLLARKWWECGDNACDQAPRDSDWPVGPVGIHMGEHDKFRKKNCRTLECYYANSATGWNVPGTSKKGYRWGADGELGEGATRPNVGDRLTEYGGLGAPWAGYDAHNADPKMVQERKLGAHDIHGGLKIDLNRGAPRTEKRPFHYAFQGGLLGKDANAAINHEDEVLVRHSSVGLPRWDAEGEALRSPSSSPPPPLMVAKDGDKDLETYLNKAIDFDGTTARGPSPHQDDEYLFGDIPLPQDDGWDSDKAHGPKGEKQPLLGEIPVLPWVGMNFYPGTAINITDIGNETLNQTLDHDVWGDKYAPHWLDAPYAAPPTNNSSRAAAGWYKCNTGDGLCYSSGKDAWDKLVMPGHNLTNKTAWWDGNDKADKSAVKRVVRKLRGGKVIVCDTLHPHKYSKKHHSAIKRWYKCGTGMCFGPSGRPKVRVF